jgi:hypothetical protein
MYEKMNNTIKVLIAIALLLVAGTIIGFVLTPGYNPREKTLNDYLSLDIWEKEKTALKYMEEIPQLSELEDAKKAVNEVAGLFREIEAYIKELKYTDPEIIRMNRIQLDICRIFQEMAAKFEKVDSFNTDALKDLAVINAKFAEFFQMSDTVK